MSLVHIGVTPQQTYGHKVQGAAPSTAKEYRRNLNVAANISYHVATTAALHWRFKADKDLEVRIRTEQLEACYDL